MRFSVRSFLALSAWLQFAIAQSSTPVAYTDPGTGIKFDTWTATTAKGAMTFGLVLPSTGLTTDSDEFIGILTCSSPNGQNTGWCGLSLGGPMTNSLLLTAYPYQGTILTSFRYATGYDMPDLYTGNAKLTQISSSVNSTSYTLIYRCQGCLRWNQDGATGGQSTSGGFLVLGWALAYASPTGPSCPNTIGLAQHDGQSIFGASLDSSAANPSYSAWAAKATTTVTGNCGTSTVTSSVTASATQTATTSSVAGPTRTGIPVPSGASFDYVIVGGGAGGIPLADKLSEAGKSVLLIEKGPPSSGRWGGKVKPDWLTGTNLTRFDVPGLCNEIWANSSGIACTDTDQMAGCVLGGGTAINAGLWWKPNPVDWDYNFPSGWKSGDMSSATNRVFSRIPGTYTPSADGKIYLPQGYNVIANGLKQSGWTEVAANSDPGRKNRTFTHTPYMYSHGERGGPLATYLVTANARNNFKLWTKTSVKRVIRNGGHIIGVEVEPYLDGGYVGIVNITSVTGRVVLSAGTFGSAKLLLRSGIGPSDQLSVVQGSTDGPAMIANSSWINLPVGYNLEDHVNTDTVVSHPDVVFYDFYEAYDTPNATDAKNYLNNRIGILAQAAPNIGPLFFETITGADGITRQLQWTARIEGSLGAPNGKTITMSMYLGRGAVSRGRMTITSSLNTVVSTQPYLNDKNDVAAVIQGIKNVQAALKNVPNLTWNFPPANQTVEDYVNTMVVSYSNRRANHWIGTNKMGTDDGRQPGGTAVVDTNTRVWGTDNLFVVDASIFPGMVTTNPSAYIVVAAERASERILALPANVAAARYAQCGGIGWAGSYLCAAPYACQYQNPYYSQCL